MVVSINRRAARPGFASGCFPLTRRYACSEVNERLSLFLPQDSHDANQQQLRRFQTRTFADVRCGVGHFFSQLGVMLFKPGLEPVSGLFSWIRLPLRLAEFGAIRQILMNRRAAVLVHETAPRRCAASTESMLAPGMISMMSFVATCMSSPGMPSTPRKYSRGTKGKDYADD